MDLERKQPVDLLSDRNADSVKAWFEEPPGVEIVVRDRSGLFADGAKRGAPAAMQVVDRYHLIKNLVEALERFFLHKQAALGAVHKKQQAHQKYHAKDVDVTTIAQHMGASRQTVYRYLQMNEPPKRKQPLRP